MEKKLRKSELLEGIGKEQRRELCKFFNITEKQLCRSLIRENCVTRINLLKLSFGNPEEWRVIYNNMHTYVKEARDTDEFIEIAKSIYTAQTGNVKFRKYVESAKNEARINYERLCFETLVNEMKKTDDRETQEFYAFLLYEHSLLLLCDIGLVEPFQKKQRKILLNFH